MWLWALVVKNLTVNAEDTREAGLTPGLERSPREETWQPTPGFSPGESHGQSSPTGSIQSMGLQRVGYNWAANTFTFCHTAKHKLGFKEAEEPESKLPTFVGSWTKQRSSRKTSTSASLTMLKPLTMWIMINWKILKETGIPDHFTCLLRNLHKGQEATGRTRHGTTDWLESGKEVQQSCILSPAYLTSMWRTSREMWAWMEHMLESTLPGEITTSDVKMISL